MNDSKNILFLCVANSARSQMAEGLAKFIYKDDAHIQSADSSPSVVNPYAIAVMKEIGIDITGQKSTSVSSVDPTNIDLVITLCAEEVCPFVLSKAKRLHWPLQDPDRKNETITDEERLSSFRIARDEIKKRIVKLYQKPVM